MIRINRVSLPVLLVDIRKREKDTLPVLVRAREFRLARQVQRSRSASACCLFSTLKAECGAYLRGSPHTVLLTDCGAYSIPIGKRGPVKSYA